MPKVFSPSNSQTFRYLRTVLRDVGTLLHIPGGMALVSALVSLLLGEGFAVVPFLLMAIASIASGQLLYRLFRHSEKAQLRHAMITVALGWGLIPLMGAIPFALIAQHLMNTGTPPLTVQVFLNPLNCLFEAYSGFTSTGLSMALRPSELPRSLLWWRSLMEWIGGIGVIVLVISVLEPSTNPHQLYSAEGRQQIIGLTLRDTVRKIWWIYLLYTSLSILWLRLVGMPWWDALNHAMTGISTGGFAITDNSIGSYSEPIQAAVIPIMLLGAISFSVHYRLLRHRRLSALWDDVQHRTLWLLLGLGTVILLLEHYKFRGQIPWIDAAFQWASALGTCGFSTVDLQNWSSAAKLLLAIAMVFGCTTGSTVGGLKLNRVSALFHGILWRFQRIALQPHQMMRYELNGEIVSETEANRRVESAAVLAMLWLGLIGLGVFILLQFVSPDYFFEDVLFEAASALGSVGLSSGITHPNLAQAGKIILILFMWMGRLEIIPVLLLLSLPLGLLKRWVNRRLRRHSG